MNRQESPDSFLPLPRTRAIVLDVVRWSRRVPSFPVEQTWDVNELSRLRNRCNSQPDQTADSDPRFPAHRVSWAALFLRAYALACRDYAPLRQSYHGFLWGRIYQSAHVGIAISVNRRVDDHDQLYFGRLGDTDQLNIRAIQDQLNYFQYHDPQVAFRQQYQAARLPRLLRDLIWWWRLEVDYRNRNQRIGSASLSTLAGHGAYNRHHPCLLTSSLSYGPIDAKGQTLVTLQCDHRVMDGVQACQALKCLKDHFEETVRNELSDMLQKHAELTRTG